MGNYSDTKKEVRNYLFARVPLIVVQSSERERVEKIFRELASEMSIPIYYYTDVKQVTSLGASAKKDVDKDPLAFAQELFRKNRNSTFVIGDARRLGDENALDRKSVV